MNAKWIVIGSFLCTLNAFAYPAVGDRVEYQGTVTQKDGTVIPLTLVKEVVSYNDTTKEFTVREEEDLNGAKKVDQNDESSLYTSERFKEISTNCVPQGGVIETITVPAGEFATCRVTTTDSEDAEPELTWFGDVPFGAVKLVEMDDGATRTLELFSVKNGQ